MSQTSKESSKGSASDAQASLVDSLRKLGFRERVRTVAEAFDLAEAKRALYALELLWVARCADIGIASFVRCSGMARATVYRRLPVATAFRRDWNRARAGVGEGSHDDYAGLPVTELMREQNSRVAAIQRNTP